MYDIKEIKAIPISDVARKYGIDLEKKHGRLWGKLRNENTASFSINLAKNLWYDFGAGKGGSVIDLVAEIEGITSTEAINKLAEEYSLKKEVTKGWHPLTDTQYRELGIEPERATMNFNFDLRIHTPEQLSRWNQKYGMPLRELADKLPEAYNKLVSKIGMENINGIRDAYFTKVKLAIDTSLDPKQREVYKKWAEMDSVEINGKVDLLQRAYKGNSSFIQALRVDPVRDFRHFEAQNKGQPKVLSEDEIIREKIVKVYKKLYNFQQADYLTVEHAKALQALNTAATNSDNKYMPIQEIKELYKLLGNNLQTFEAMYSKVMKDGELLPKGDNPQYQEWLSKANNLKNDIAGVKELFSKASTVIEGLREVAVAYKNDVAKQNAPEKPLVKDMDLTR